LFNIEELKLKNASFFARTVLKAALSSVGKLLRTKLIALNFVLKESKNNELLAEPEVARVVAFEITFNCANFLARTFKTAAKAGSK
jgi:hypothetical protein